MASHFMPCGMKQGVHCKPQRAAKTPMKCFSAAIGGGGRWRSGQHAALGSPSAVASLHACDARDLQVRGDAAQLARSAERSWASGKVLPEPVLQFSWLVHCDNHVAASNLGS